jgi:excisionase family DNA binding protein
MAVLTLDDKTLYDVPEIATRLGVGVFTVRQYIRKGLIKGIKVGRKYWVEEKELAKLFDAGTASP